VFGFDVLVKRSAGFELDGAVGAVESFFVVGFEMSGAS
jgi:hypothetical protein